MDIFRNQVIQFNQKYKIDEFNIFFIKCANNSKVSCAINTIFTLLGMMSTSCSPCLVLPLTFKNQCILYNIVHVELYIKPCNINENQLPEQKADFELIKDRVLTTAGSHY